MKISTVWLGSVIFSILMASNNVVFANNINAIQENVVRLSEPVTKDSTSETFGIPLNTSLDTIELSELMSNTDGYKERPFLLKTKISKVCQKKGCFFIAQQDETVVRVSFKDYGFFIPSDSSGKTVMLTGQLHKKEISKAQATHFAQDLKTENSPIKAGVVYEIVATSVKIPIS